MFISEAWAQDGGGGDLLITFLPLILIFAIFYFLLIRPQQKKQKDHQAKIRSIRRGDRVVTGGGIFGNVTKVLDENELQVEIAEGVRVRVAASTVMDVLAKAEPARVSRGGKSGRKAKTANENDGAKQEGTG